MKDELQFSCPPLIYHMHITSLMLPFLHGLLLPGFGFLFVYLEFYVSISNSSPDSSIEVKNLFLIGYKYIFSVFFTFETLLLEHSFSKYGLVAFQASYIAFVLGFILGIFLLCWIFSFLDVMSSSFSISLHWSTSSSSSFLRKGVWEVNFGGTYRSRKFVQILNSRLEIAG